MLYLTHQSIVTLDHSPGNVAQLEFDPRGEFLAVVDSQGALCVWNWLEERRMSGFADATTRVTSIAFDPAGERLAAVISGAAVRVWRTRDGAELFRLGELGATTVAFNRDGRLLATAETASHVVRVWDGVDGRPQMVLEGHTRNVQRLAFTEDARRLISQNSAEAFAWDLETGQLLARTNAPQETLRDQVRSHARRYWRQRVGGRGNGLGKPLRDHGEDPAPTGHGSHPGQPGHLQTIGSFTPLHRRPH